MILSQFLEYNRNKCLFSEFSFFGEFITVFAKDIQMHQRTDIEPHLPSIRRLQLRLRLSDDSYKHLKQLSSPSFLRLLNHVPN